MSKLPSGTMQYGDWHVSVSEPEPFNPRRFRHNLPDTAGQAVGYTPQGVVAGKVNFEISGNRLSLANMDFGPEGAGNETGEDNTGHGLGTAILDALEEMFPDLQFAELGGSHTAAGVMFMENRALSGKRRIHAFDCPGGQADDVCTCEVRPGRDHAERVAKLRAERDSERSGPA
ncbi:MULTISPECIES: hypothetical protein [unclassified Knoellia]|uniref:hypothetical protein n=1 Tax=Knoellia altitudinis TaxID=3404795 RepID=UPI003609F506